jgi:methylmalonyl-CoA mutase N-terminal domain/subunit
MEEIEQQGGSTRCVENGYFRNRIAAAAYETQKEIESGAKIVVGVNKYDSGSVDTATGLKIDPELEKTQIARLSEVKRRRDDNAVEAALKRLKDAAAKDDNVVEPVLNAVEEYATVGEISDVFRGLWGEYHESA